MPRRVAVSARVDAAHGLVVLARRADRAGDRLTRDVRLRSECLGYLGVEAIPCFKRIEILVICKIILKLRVCIPKLLQVLCSPIMNGFLIRRPLMPFLESAYGSIVSDHIWL